MTAHSLSGLALHSGVASTLSVSRRSGGGDGTGARFFWPGFDAPLRAADLGMLRREARRATVLENPAGGAMRTPEHLLAAALFFADAPLDIRCDAAEPPGLDGSALPFYRLFQQALSPERDQTPAGVRESEARSLATEDDTPVCRSRPGERAREYDSNLEWSHEGSEGSLRARPHDRFSVDYAWEDGEVLQRFAWEAGDDPEPVLSARTFIAWRDWKRLAGTHAENLLAGAGAESGLLIASTAAEFAEARERLPESRGKAFPLVHPEAFRGEDELARHKVLDLLGDLALNGLALPRLRLTIRNGGHALNHLLLDRLQGGFRSTRGPHERRDP